MTPDEIGNVIQTAAIIVSLGAAVAALVIGAKRANAEHGWSFDFHDLRHFHASGLIAAGCDAVIV